MKNNIFCEIFPYFEKNEQFMKLSKAILFLIYFWYSKEWSYIFINKLRNEQI